MLNGQFLSSEVFYVPTFSVDVSVPVLVVLFIVLFPHPFFSSSTPESCLSLDVSSGFFCSPWFFSRLFIPLLDLPFAASSAFQPCI